jgi:glutathione synthase/RimK-type ligase-like ATP-grasp enzyme
MGHEVTPVPWDGQRVNWNAQDVVVLRSTWNYHHAFDAFGRWLATLEAAGVTVLNPVPLLRWNAHKRYLLDLAAADIRIPETVLVPRGMSRGDLEPLLARRWVSAVIKPAVSANAYLTERVALQPLAAYHRRVGELAAHGDVLAQELLTEVERRGEYSAVFFNGEFSHAVLKRPRAGEFRVQEKYGGTIESVEPDATLLAASRVVLAALPSLPAYARLDLVQEVDGWTLMEVELIEPTLFLQTSPDAAERFASAIVARSR